jgi:hypothetical protein
MGSPFLDFGLAEPTVVGIGLHLRARPRAEFDAEQLHDIGRLGLCALRKIHEFQMGGCRGSDPVVGLFKQLRSKDSRRTCFTVVRYMNCHRCLRDCNNLQRVIRARCAEHRLNSAFRGLFSASCGSSFSGHGYPTQCAANTCRPRSDRFWLLELRVSRTFLDILRLICSGHGYPAQRAANTSCPRSNRFWLLELRVSRHFSTFYEPSVQAMDTQLGARHRRRPPTIHRGSAQRVGRGA